MASINDNLPMPKELMPEAWFIDERMNSMFAEFRNRSVNPQDWDSKCKFWEGIITSWLSYKKQCTFDIIQLSTTFKRKGRTPLCLSTVVEELYKKGEITSEQEFLNDNTSWTSWAINTMVKKPVVWSFFKMKDYLLPQKTITSSETKYIHFKTLQEISDLILNLSVDKDLILSVAQITKKCCDKYNNKNITEENIRMALLWLSKLKKGPIIQPNMEKHDLLLKVSSTRVDNLTEGDESLFKLKESERLLLEKIEKLEIEKNDLLIKAKLSMDNGLKEIAKTHLRKKREFDKRIERQAATLQNLQTLISNIHDAHSNTDVLAAYKRGSDLLKGFEKSGLNEFNARDAIDDMTEAVNEYREIQSVLSETIKANDSDSELEQELEDILNSSVKDTSLPTVPDTSLPDLEKELEALNMKGVNFVDKNTPKKIEKTTNFF